MSITSNHLITNYKVKKDLKIKFTDFYSEFIWDKHCLYKYLSKNYNLILSENPDIIVYSCYGTFKISCENFKEVFNSSRVNSNKNFQCFN